MTVLKNKQIRYLFLTSFLVLFTGMGLFPILPLYAAQFQAGNSLTGLYFAIVYVANALAPLAVGALITRFPKRWMLVSSALSGLPALILLAVARNFTQVVALTALLWFSGGAVLALVSIFTGLHAEERDRGKAYSLMAMAAPLGSLVGGGFIGALVTWKGYPFMFAALAVLWTAVPLTSWLLLKEGLPGTAKRIPARQASASGRSAGTFARDLGAPFARLLVVVFAASVAVNVSRFGASLAMRSAGFTPENVSSTAVVSGLVAIPFTLAMGSLSDRLGRRHFFGISLLFVLSATLILTRATALWQYGLASILNMVSYSAGGAMAQALTGEVVPARSRDRGLSWLNTLNAGANILCFAAGGLLFDLLGQPVVFLIAALVAAAAGTGVELLVRPAAPQPVVDCTKMVTEGCGNK